MELATSELLRCFNGDAAIENLSRALRLCAEGLQHETYRAKHEQHLDRSDIDAITWLADVQVNLLEISRIENSYDIPFDIKRPEWYEKERLANS